MPQQHRIGKTATTVRVMGQWLYVTYRGTDVVRANLDTREVTLNTGGWKSATTKSRMNQTASQYDLGFHVYQEKGEWNVTIRDTGQTLPFYRDELIFKTSRVGSLERLRERNRVGLPEESEG